MPRILSTSIQAAIAAGGCPIAHLLTFTVGETTYRYSEDQRSFQGNQYMPGLSLRSPLRHAEQLQAERVVVAVQNVTLSSSVLLQTTASSVQGQEATLERLFLKAADALLLFRGRLDSIEIDEQELLLTLISDFDPLASRIPTRQYSALCSWNFMDSNCGYVPNEDPLDPQTALPYSFCPKDFTSCKQRGRAHRFPGFIHLTRELTETLI